MTHFNSQEFSRYTRHIQLGDIGVDGQRKLKSAQVLIVGCGGLGALSDKVGRKPLMAWSALGFAATNLLQASAGAGSIGRLYLADAPGVPVDLAAAAECFFQARIAQPIREL